LADPRLAAVANLQAVLDGRSLDAVLAAAPAATDDRDRALAAELSYGVCRWYFRLDALIGRLLQRPLKARDRDLHLLLLVGAYQLLYSRIPPHAAVATAVDACRGLGKGWAGGLVNGVLRRLQREQDALAATVDQDAALRHALPPWLYQVIVDAWPAQAGEILGALQQRPPMTLRVDLRRISLAEYAARLAQAGLAARPHPAVASAVTLDEPVPVDRLPGFAEGLASVQDAGAQLAVALLDPRPGERVLDACAAPGGKTLALAQHAPGIELTALDIDPGRLERVAQNLARGAVQARILAGDAASPAGAAWADAPYQRILADVPCSATGVLRRHPDIRLLRRAADIDALVERQAAILDALWGLLAPGGRLLYVTCSLLPRENAEQIDAFLQRHPEAEVVALPAAAGTAAGKGVQLLPGIDDTDGFFYAALTRPVAAST
jgi:16S rRNA (cytosine967-C5)-methyltransferase